MKTTNWRVAVWRGIGTQPVSFLTLVALVFSSTSAFADGVFVWKKEKDINEPTQKAIILYDQNRENLILQVKFEGAAEEFGWLIPVPGQPEVRKGSMEAFYELSQITQRHFWNSYWSSRSMAFLRKSVYFRWRF